MSSGIIQAAIFAAGAAVGGGIATVTIKRAGQRPAELALPPPNAIGTIPPPVVQVSSKAGIPSFSAGNLASVATLESPVLKYGNPGPIADPIIRKAYVAAYDRRLRHPAWVSACDLLL